MSLYVQVVDRSVVRLWNYFVLRHTPRPDELPVETTCKLWVMRMWDNLPASEEPYRHWVAHDSQMCYGQITAAILLPWCIGYATRDHHRYHYDKPYGCYSVRFNVFPVPVCVCERYLQPRCALERLAAI